ARQQALSAEHQVEGGPGELVGHALAVHRHPGRRPAAVLRLPLDRLAHPAPAVGRRCQRGGVTGNGSETMRHILLIMALFTAALPARAAEEPKPNTLTPEESAGGWTLLFDGEKFTGLRIDGEHQVVDGVLVVGGKTETRITVTRVLLRNFELHFQYRTEV